MDSLADRRLDRCSRMARNAWPLFARMAISTVAGLLAIRIALKAKRGCLRSFLLSEGNGIDVYAGAVDGRIEPFSVTIENCVSARNLNAVRISAGFGRSKTTTWSQGASRLPIARSQGRETMQSGLTKSRRRRLRLNSSDASRMATLEAMRMWICCSVTSRILVGNQAA